MSEFMCKNGHLMAGSEKYCPVCGSPAYYMDGLTGSQLKQMEQEEIAKANNLSVEDIRDEN